MTAVRLLLGALVVLAAATPAAAQVIVTGTWQRTQSTVTIVLAR
jgi:hypothetical protein